MRNLGGSCLLNVDQILNEYFLESRHRLLELAAFLDRLDRAQDGIDPRADFRVAALINALGVLLDGGPQRVRHIQMILSDPTEEPRQQLDRKAAWGAYATPQRK